MTSLEPGRSKVDPYKLGRFIAAQEGTYDDALNELKRGKKSTHWMWFVFPQIDGLGYSSTSKFYSIKSVEEARAYLEHPLLGSRLNECVDVVIGLHGLTILEIFGKPDDLKFHASMTLFEHIAGYGSAFNKAIGLYFNGVRHARTLQLLHLTEESK